MLAKLTSVMTESDRHVHSKYYLHYGVVLIIYQCCSRTKIAEYQLNARPTVGD